MVSKMDLTVSHGPCGEPDEAEVCGLTKYHAVHTHTRRYEVALAAYDTLTHAWSSQKGIPDRDH